jgi:hypothetical protein
VSPTVATFTDADTAATASEYSATINWGDGTSSSGTITGSSGKFTVKGTHTYKKTGTFTVKVTITDVDNTPNSATVSTTATVHSPATKPAKVVHGRARLSGVPAACTLRPVTADVKGRRISSVRWSLDDRALTGKTVKRGRTYSVRVSVSPGKHHLSAKVKFVKASHTHSRTLRATVSGCPAVAPRFTG